MCGVATLVGVAAVVGVVTFGDVAAFGGVADIMLSVNYGLYMISSSNIKCGMYTFVYHIL